MTVTSIEDLKDGDRARVIFVPPRREDDALISMAEGTVRGVAGMIYIQAENHRRAWAMPMVLDLRGEDIREVHRLETAGEVEARKAQAARGEIVVTETPATAEGYEDALMLLAEMIDREPDRRAVGGRQQQLLRQMDELADQIALARTKRHYLLTRAALGRDFHPWTDGAPEIFRNGTVRPLPCDFSPDIAQRKDRALRLEQSVRIFGEAERETRRMLSALRAAGFDARRPHPDAQEIRVRYREGRIAVDLGVRPSANGLWEAVKIAPDNKGKARVLARVLERGALRALAEAVDAAQRRLRN